MNQNWETPCRVLCDGVADYVSVYLLAEQHRTAVSSGGGGLLARGCQDRNVARTASHSWQRCHGAHAETAPVPVHRRPSRSSQGVIERASARAGGSEASGTEMGGLVGYCVCVVSEEALAWRCKGRGATRARPV